MSNIVKSGNALPVQNMQDFAAVGDLIAASGMFGAKNQAEGFVIAGMCHQTGMSYMEFMETYHFFQGRISMRADAMLSKLIEHGGTFEVVKRTPAMAEIKVQCGSAKGNFSFSWEDAVQEPFIYAGGPRDQLKELEKPLESRTFKPKYQTPRSRMQMLWARVISDGVRTVCPQAVRGCYTPEEISDFSETPANNNSAPVKINPEEVAKRSESIKKEAKAKSEPKPKSKPEEKSVSKEMEDATVVNDKPAPKSTPDFKQGVAPDYNKCPVRGNLFNVAWSEMDVKTLEMALTLTNPEMTKEYMDVVKATLALKKG